jgi:hypothetical protein
MKKSRFLAVLSVLILLSLVNGCNTSDDSAAVPDTGDRLNLEKMADTVATDEFFTGQGLELKQTVTKDGWTGYLAEFRGKVSRGVIVDYDKTTDYDIVLEERGPFTKKCMVLTGAPYSLGYQAAMLGCKEAYPMFTAYLKDLFVSEIASLGVEVKPQNYDKVYRLIYECASEFNKMTEPDIPQYLKDEMKGFADGMKDAGYPDITYENVMMLNQAIDNTFYLISAVTGNVEITDRNRKAVWLARKNLIKILLINNGIVTDAPEKYLKPKIDGFGCNEFAVTGSMTSNGHTWHGRDFMFATDNICQDSTMVVIYLPDRGYPFAAVTTPGVIGQTTVLNSRGLSIGQDYVMTNVTGETPGNGCMLVVRDIVQNCSNLSEAVERMRNISRGVSWIYFAADDEADPEYGNAVALETITNHKKIKGPDELPIWEMLLFAKYIFRLDKDQLDDDGYIDRGVMLRGMKWQFPEEFKKYDKVIERKDRDSFDVFKEYLEHYTSGIYFKDTVEKNPEYVIANNHFLIPRLNLLHYEPLSFLSIMITSVSAFRYDAMMDLIEANKVGMEFFGDGDVPAANSAGWIIDFLNTQRENWWQYRDGNWDIDDSVLAPVDIPVEGSKSLIDNDTREMISLFGYNTDPWVKVNLNSFTEWFYSE